MNKISKYFLCLLQDAFTPSYMKKIILLLAISLGFAFSSSAQNTGFGNFNLGLYGAIPLNNMKNIFNDGIGGSLKYEYHFKSYLNFTMESGYETFGVKGPLQNAYVPSTYSYVPVKWGVKYYPIGGLYAEVQAGVVYYTQHGGGSAFDFSPGIGYSFKPGFEIGIRYEEWNQDPEKHIDGDYGQTGPFKVSSNFAQMALRIAERF